jgi:hypothetical protein
MRNYVTREEAMDMEDAHAQGLHEETPRDFCPTCTRRELSSYPTAAEVNRRVRPVPNDRSERLPIIGRERALLDQLTKALHSLVGGPPPTNAQLAVLRRHNSGELAQTRYGNTFEVQLTDPDDRQPTGHIVRVTVELDRFERGD